MFRAALVISEQQIANGAAIVSNGSAGIGLFSYLSGFNELLTSIALIIAIISGLISLWKHYRGKSKEED